jgi:hypothetical protein
MSEIIYKYPIDRMMINEEQAIPMTPGFIIRKVLGVIKQGEDQEFFLYVKGVLEPFQGDPLKQSCRRGYIRLFITFTGMEFDLPNSMLNHWDYLTTLERFGYVYHFFCKEPIL